MSRRKRALRHSAHQRAATATAQSSPSGGGAALRLPSCLGASNPGGCVCGEPVHELEPNHWNIGEASDLISDQKPLLRAIIDALLVLENSPPDEIDSHVAVTAMESIASELLTLSREDQRHLRSAFLEIATESQDAGYQEFVKAVPDMVDLAK